jgi:hypothetical protein
MAIDEPDVHLTRAELQRYRQRFEQAVMFLVDPPTFEAWVARQVKLDAKPGRERFHYGR